jgi:hypothetical protein
MAPGLGRRVSASESTLPAVKACSFGLAEPEQEDREALMCTEAPGIQPQGLLIVFSRRGGQTLIAQKGCQAGVPDRALGADPNGLFQRGSGGTPMAQLDTQVPEMDESIEVPRVGLEHGQVCVFRGLVSVLQVEGAGTFE